MAKILVVDDEEHMTALICRRLQAHGIEVDEAFSGAEALERIQKNSYDLVLLDFSMPSMRGDEVCQVMRGDSRFKDTPVIIITAFQNRDVEFFTDEGATDVIYKPIDTYELLERVKKYIGLN